MANIPTPDVAKGTAAGAKQGLSASEFHSGPFHDIRDFGASTGASDNSSAIEDALKQAASDGGAAVVPEGKFAVSGWRGVDITSGMDGATLLGAAGADSVITGENIGIAFWDNSHQDVTIANLRVSGGSKAGIASPADGSGTASNLHFENIWVHDGGENNISFNMGGSGTLCEMKNISVWGANRWHGVSLHNTGGYVNISNIVAWNNGLGDTSTGGHGVDASGEYARIDGFLFVNNMYGSKTTPENIKTEYRNGAILDGHRSGFHGYGTDSGVTVFDNVLARGCGWEGFSLRSMEYHIPTRIWAMDNCKNPESGETHGGIEYAYGATMDINEMQVGGTQNGYPGVNQTGSDDATGTVDVLVASNNSDGTFGSRSNVSYGSVKNQACSVPTIEEIVGSASDSAAVHYHDGTGWQNASVRYYDGQEYKDVTINQISSS